MRQAAARVSVGLVCLLTATILYAQPSSRSAADSVPRVMHMTGVFVPANGQPAGAVETVTVAIYAEEKGGTPLWEETQQVAVEVMRARHREPASVYYRFSTMYSDNANRA